MRPWITAVGLVLDQIKATNTNSWSSFRPNWSKLVRPTTINAKGKVIAKQTTMTMGGSQRLDDLLTYKYYVQIQIQVFKKIQNAKTTGLRK